jgi:outer membrane lipoprotein-sorting protein
MRSIKARFLLGVLVIIALQAVAPAADGKSAPAKLTAAQIVQKHLAARGGAQAWAGVQTLACNGKMDLGYGDALARSRRYMTASASRNGKGARGLPPWAVTKSSDRKQVQVPFVLEMKRPGKSRVEIEFGGKKAVQVFDGKNGFMLRPFLNRDDWVPFTAEQVAQQRRWNLEDPLMEHAAAGTRVELASTGRVGGREAYELKLTRKDGSVQHVWIDARTFLDVKVEGAPRRMDGKLRTVWVTQRDFRPVKGVMVPFVLETSVDGFPDTHRVVVDKVALNPRLDDARFTKPRT